MLSLQARFDTGCFNDNYSSCRLAFQDELSNLPSPLVSYKKSFLHPCAGPDEDELACDVVLLGQSALPKKLLVLISGTHGVEGFAGSAVQVDFMKQLSDVLMNYPQLGVLMIHAFNPWGFAWLRRADHEGIDLNRNFIDFSKQLPANADYDSFQPLLNDRNWLTKQDISALWQGRSFTDFLEQVTRGQYSDNRGLFYGGEQASWSRRVLEEITSNRFITEAEILSVIDLHTGLGPYGYGEVISDHQPNSTGSDWAERIYGANTQSALEGASFSTPKLGLVDYHWHDVIAGRGCFVTLEFGTYDPQQLIAVLLREQIYHNQLLTHQRREFNSTYIHSLKAFFYPLELSWQQQILFRGRQVISMALSGIQP